MLSALGMVWYSHGGNKVKQNISILNIIANKATAKLQEKYFGI